MATPQDWYDAAGTPDEGAEKLLPWEKPRPKFGAPARTSVVDVRETAALSSWDMPVTLDKAIHQPHLENFFAAVRGQGTLNCDGAHAFASEAAIFQVNPAVAARAAYDYKPSDFVA